MRASPLLDQKDQLSEAVSRTAKSCE